MSGVLEQSLDEIIGDNQPRRRERSGRPRGSRGASSRRPAPSFRPSHGSGIPSQIFRDANGRPLLRLKNVHGDLDGEDLNNLFLNIAPVDFVKFDPREETTAYVCFQSNNSENNARAISKFDGKKAMGNTLIVENATSLADRIAPSRPQRDTVRGGRDSRPPRDDSAKEAPRVRARKPKARKPRPVKKTAEDLDAELSAYMGETSEPAPAFSAQDNGEMAD